MRGTPLTILIYTGFLTSAAYATAVVAQPETQELALEFDAGLVGTYLDSDESGVDSEAFLSLDLVTAVGFGPGQIRSALGWQ